MVESQLRRGLRPCGSHLFGTGGLWFRGATPSCWRTDRPGSSAAHHFAAADAHGCRVPLRHAGPDRAWRAMERPSAIEDLESRIGAANGERQLPRGDGRLASQISSLQAAVDALGVRAAVDPAASLAMDKLPAIVKSRAMGGDRPRAWSGRCSAARSARPTTRSACSASCSARSRAASISCGTASSAGTRSPRPRRPSGRSPAGCPRGTASAATPSPAARISIPGWTSRPTTVRRSRRRPMASWSARRQRQLRKPHRHRARLRDHDPVRTSVALCAVSGQQVRRGDIMGYVGSTGRSTSAHLHYEILLNGQLTNPLKLLTGR